MAFKSASLIAPLLVSSIFVSTIVIASLTIYSIGSLHLEGLEAYYDELGVTPLTEINWGNMSRGETKNFTFYLQLTSHTPAVLNMTTMNYDSVESQQYLNLTWNYIEDTVIDPEDIFPVTMMLNVSSEAEGFEDFLFEIYIVATGVEEL